MKIVIPARYASSRLPGKPLADIAGQPMVWHVWQRACEALDAADVFIATDDGRIMDTVCAFGGQGVETAAHHASGTDRIAEVAAQLGWADEEIVINVQGDEPLIPPALIRQVGEALDAAPEAAISTASHRIASEAELLSPNAVKVVTDKAGFAAYFSRAAIPFDREAELPDIEAYPYQRHIGIYAYRVSTLKVLAGLDPAPTEKLESLEQLRALWHGLRIIVTEVAEAPPAGVDTEADLQSIRRLLEIADA